MIIDDLVIHDFGVYGGRQAATLRPTSPARPITLFGGLNGAGKTTLLDAVQLGLYGPHAAVSNRSGGYDDYLARSVNRSSISGEAAIEIALRTVTEGREVALRIHRSWTSANGRVRERFEVVRDGRPDALAAEHWHELVEELMPARIAELFLFDGERVGAYADLDSASRLVRTAIQNLLGLDIVERLSADLGLLERRKRPEAAQQTPIQQDQLAALAADIERLESERRVLIQRRAAAVNEIERLSATLHAAEETFRREGGDTAERRIEIEKALSVEEHRALEARRALGEVAGGMLPLALVAPLLAGVSARTAASEEAWRRSLAADAVAAERQAFREIIAQAALPIKAASKLNAMLDARPDLIVWDGTDGVSEPSSALRQQLATAKEGLVEATAQAAHLCRELATSRGRAADLSATLSSIPSSDRLDPIARARDEARQRLTSARAEQDARDDAIARLDRELGDARIREQTAHEAALALRFAEEDLGRLLTRSSQVRSTLVRFREAVVTRHASRIEAAILASFHDLARKRTLVTGVRIDPVTFSIALTGGRGEAVTPERLSAGERQLLAIAILWGLARASGRPLPTMIDTPLGRLDSSHRQRLIRHYFPKVSHQTILLSTDEEIAGRSLEELRPAIGRSYRLVHDDARATTRIEPGFMEVAHGH